MRTDKRKRAISQYNGHKGLATVAHVERNIEQAYPMAHRDLTGVQYGRLMSVANASYHDGRASAGASVEDDVLCLSGSPLLPLALLHKIKATARTEYDYRPIIPGGGQDPLAHLSGPQTFYRRTTGGEYEQITSADVPGSEYWPDWQRAQVLLPETLYLCTTWHITDYYIGDNLVFTERC